MSYNTIKIKCPVCESDFNGIEYVDEKCPICDSEFEWIEYTFENEYSMDYYSLPHWF